jgi:hypothetical protein
MRKLLSMAFSLGLLTTLFTGAALAQEEETPTEEVSGTIEAVDADASTITIAGTTLTVTDATVIDKDGEACSLGDLEVGMEVSATYNPDTMEAVEIHATSAVEPAEEVPSEAPLW